MISAVALFAGLCLEAGASPVVLDFETEDDFSTPLVNGQVVDLSFDTDDVEFGRLVSIRSKQLGQPDGHLGVTVFDSSSSGVNSSGRDVDLLVNLGNILILQSAEFPVSSVDPTYGLRYETPDDEDRHWMRGSIVFDFIDPVELTSIVVIDADEGFRGDFVLTDDTGKTRSYVVPSDWTFDRSIDGPDGFQTLFLDSLAPQVGEGGATATAVEDLGFDPTRVRQLEVQFNGSPGSGGLDNLVIVPEPSTIFLALLGFFATIGLTWRNRRLRTA